MLTVTVLVAAALAVIAYLREQRDIAVVFGALSLILTVLLVA